MQNASFNSIGDVNNTRERKGEKRSDDVHGDYFFVGMEVDGRGVLQCEVGSVVKKGKCG